MARRTGTRTRKAPKPKVMKLEFIERKIPGRKIHPTYRTIEHLVGTVHKDLADAKIACAWWRGCKANKDGIIPLGKAKKASSLDRQLHDYDWVICLNEEWWNSASDAQREALCDHELCHCVAAYNRDGVQDSDAKGRKLWRVRKHDVEEFAAVIRRHGLYKQDLELLFAAAKEGQPGLFEQSEKVEKATKAMPETPPMRIAQ